MKKQYPYSITVEKIAFYIFISTLFFLQPNYSLAVSGACSYHRGVNCSNDSSLYGYAVCNDGWVSSTLLSDTDECHSSLSDICPSPLVLGYVDGSQCRDIQAQCDENNSRIRAICAAEGLVGSPSCPSTNTCPEADFCKQQVANYSLEVQAHDECVKDAFQQLDEKIIRSQDDSCQLTYGTFSHYDSNYQKCFCNKGYIFANGQCETPISMCQKLSGNNSYPDQALSPSTGENIYTCICKAGYSKNSVGICEVVPDFGQTKMISINVLNKTHNDFECTTAGLSQDEIAQCHLFYLHHDDYKWQGFQPPTTTSVPSSASSQNLPPKNNLQQNNITSQPKKLTNNIPAEVKTIKLKITNTTIISTSTKPQDLDKIASTSVSGNKIMNTNKASNLITRIISFFKFW